MYKIALILVVCLSAHSINAKPSASSRDDSKHLDSADFRDEFEGTELMESRIDGLSDLAGIITIIKDQFQSILESCIAKILEHILSILKIAKHNILALLGKWSLGDIFVKILDCAANIIGLSTPAVTVVEADEVVAELPAPVPAVVNVPYTYSYPYVFRNYRSVDNITDAE